MTKIKNVGVVGLGNMGRGMALSLQRGGFAVTGLDTNPKTSLQASEAGIKLAKNLSEILSTCEAVVLSLPTSAIVKALVNGNTGIAADGRQGLLVLDTTTADPQVTRELAEALKAKGIVLLDTPVSGGPGGALKGELTMFLGGPAEAIERATPVLAAMGTKRFHIGDTGAGNIAKIINNLLTAAQLLTAGEAFRLADAAGVKTEQLLEAVNAGSGRSGVTLFNYPNRILNDGFNSGFTMQLMRKDVRLAVDLAESLGLKLPVMMEVGDLWKASEVSLADSDDFNRIVHFVQPAEAAA